jgi:hypothetical protein|nr:hypothetical protein Q903MT_gene1253 [Picea sitchensis]
MLLPLSLLVLYPPLVSLLLVVVMSPFGKLAPDPYLDEAMAIEK